jgi:hypothetical protein
LGQSYSVNGTYYIGFTGGSNGANSGGGGGGSLGAGGTNALARET